MEAKTLFHLILPGTAMGLTSKTAVNWHLKVKETKYNVGLTNSYCITVRMQKISSIHELIQQILGSQMVTPNFDHIHPKTIEITFSFPEFNTSMQKISSFYQLILEIQSISESCD